MPEDQAEILASERSHLVESELVTRTYLDLRLERLETKLEKSFKADIQALRTETHNIEKKLGGDIQALRAETHNIEKRLGGEIQNVEKKLGDKIQKVEEKLSADIQGVEKNIHRLDKQLTIIKWMLAPVMVVNVIPFLQQLL